MRPAHEGSQGLLLRNTREIAARSAGSLTARRLPRNYPQFPARRILSRKTQYSFNMILRTVSGWKHHRTKMCGDLVRAAVSLLVVQQNVGVYMTNCIAFRVSFVVLQAD